MFFSVKYTFFFSIDVLLTMILVNNPLEMLFHQKVNIFYLLEVLRYLLQTKTINKDNFWGFFFIANIT